MHFVKVCRAIHKRTVQALVQKLCGGRNSYNHKTTPITVEKKKRTIVSLKIPQGARRSAWDEVFVTNGNTGNYEPG